MRAFVEFGIEDAAESKGKSTSNTDALCSDLLKQMTSASTLREKAMDFVHTAVELISRREYIANGARRIGLDTIWGKAWEPIWQELEARGQLWKSFSRNDIVVRGGRVQDVAAYAATDEVRAEQEEAVADEVTGARVSADWREDRRRGQRRR